MGKSILFVCSGNSCRSPMAEAMMRKMLGKNKDVEISSAGLFALEGMRANENALRTMAKEGIELGRHRSRQLTQEMVNQAGVIVVMTGDHKEAIAHFSPGIEKKVFLLSEFEEDANLRGTDIPDPIAQPLEAYQRCLAQMKSPLANLVLKLMRSEI